MPNKENLHVTLAELSAASITHYAAVVEENNGNIPKRDEARAGIPAENRAPSTTEICPYTRMGMVVQILLTVGSMCVLGRCASAACFEYARWNLVNVFAFLGACGSGVG